MNKTKNYKTSIIKKIFPFVAKHKKILYSLFLVLFLIWGAWFFIIKPSQLISENEKKFITAINTDRFNQKEYNITQDFLNQKSNHRKTVAQVLGGIFLLASLYYAWKQVQLKEEGQITERFTRAIDQLDKEKSLEVRLGGIYALERIAKDSKKDHPQIMEILVAYVRENTKTNQSVQKNETNIKEDIQSILTVIGRRNWKNDRQNQIIDLRNTNLQQYTLKGYFKGIILYKSQLQKAILRGAQLQEADFRETNLQEADLSETNLQEAVLNGAHLKETALWGANLQDAILMGAHLQKADFFGSNLQDANLSKSNLQSANFSDANLQKARFFGANLQNANFFNANLQEAVLRGVNLQESILISANLYAIKGWIKIKNMKNTNISGVRDVPKGFIEFAKKHGAIEQKK